MKGICFNMTLGFAPSQAESYGGGEEATGVGEPPRTAAQNRRVIKVPPKGAT